jgi:hypothetical protein
MKNLATHTKQIGLVLPVFFLAANAGYTVVLGYCTTECVTICAMERDADLMACAMSCGESLPAHGDAFAQEESECHKVAIAGGLNFTPMVLETVLEGQTWKLYLLSCTASQNVPLHATPPLTNCVFSTSGVARQHAVEKYVLNASFLM